MNFFYFFLGGGGGGPSQSARYRSGSHVFIEAGSKISCDTTLRTFSVVFWSSTSGKTQRRNLLKFGEAVSSPLDKAFSRALSRSLKFAL